MSDVQWVVQHPRVKVSIAGSLRDREVACSASDRQGSNFESCVWRTVSSQSSHHPQEVLLAQFSLYVHKGGLKPDSFHFIMGSTISENIICSIPYAMRTSLHTSMLLCKAKRQYSLTCKVSRYCLSTLHDSIVMLPFRTDDFEYGR